LSAILTKVLENFHCAKGFEMIQEHGITEKFTNDQYKGFRSSVISMVLATDMINHFEHVSKFKTLISSDRPIDFADSKSRSIVMDFAMKCADISNAARTPRLATQWTALVMDEFFHQVVMY
jgi:hypothetical protein